MTSLLTKKLGSYVVPTTTQDIFTELNAQRIDWLVPSVSKEGFKQNVQGIETCFKRIIAIGLELELPVGSFIRAAIEKVSDIPPTAIQGMIANIQDEEKHMQTFQAIATAYPVGDEIKQAAIFREKFIKHKLNPIVKTRDLETIVFLSLQGVMRVYGGQSLERVIADISHDELRHTNYGWELSTVLKLPRYPDFENLCMQAVQWCVEPLETVNLWLEIANEIKETGESTVLAGLLNYGIHRAPFEISNANY